MSRAALAAVVLGGLAGAGSLAALGWVLLGTPSWLAAVTLYLAPFPGLAAVLVGAVAVSDRTASRRSVVSARTGLVLGLLPVVAILVALLVLDAPSG